MAQHVALRRPDLIRKLVVAAGTPGGQVPGTPPPNEKVRNIITKPEPTADDMVYLFYPDTDAARAAGYKHLTNVSTRLATGHPSLFETAEQGQLTAIANSASVPFEQVRANLETIKHPVLYANGAQDVMIPAIASYAAVQHLQSAVLVLYSDAGHGFLFQHANEFATQVTNFLAG